MAESKEGMYVSHRDVYVSTTKGFSYGFKKGVPMYVVPECRADVIAHGVLPVDGDMPLQEEVRKASPDPVGEERKNLILAAMAELAQENNSSNFSAAGVPKTNALKRVCGFGVDMTERDKLWVEYQQG